MRKIIFRLDDISPDMNYEKFKRVQDIFCRYDVKPLIGIIPANEEIKFKNMRAQSVQIRDEEIWQELKNLQDTKGWGVALHGYNHICSSEDGGILKINKVSEFAGLDYEAQKEKIKNGKRFLESLGFRCVAFMAPSHSFDEYTLRALRESGIHVLTDGKGVYPYEEGGCILMPVPYSLFWSLPFGIYTICLHSNTMREKDFLKLEKFIRRNQDKCVSFAKGVELYKGMPDKRRIEKANIFWECYMKLVVKMAGFAVGWMGRKQ